MKSLKYIFIIPVLLILINLNTSCHSSKKNTEDIEYKEKTDKKKHKEKEILGFKISKHDNIELYREADKWVGTPYRYGGNSKSGTDCSGLVMEIYRKVYDKKLQRSSSSIMSKNCKKIRKGSLKEGDLVFFATGKNKKKISHVGIYLKDGKFLHASSSRGVIVSDLDENYYEKNFVCAGRVKH